MSERSELIPCIIIIIYSGTSHNGPSEIRTPPNNGQRPRSQCVRYSEVPLYIGKKIRCHLHAIRNKFHNTLIIILWCLYTCMKKGVENMLIKLNGRLVQ